MLTRSDIPRLLLEGLKTDFINSAAQVATYFQEFTTEVPSTKAKEVYDWLGSTPALREWRDRRAPKAMLEHGFEIVNKDYEASIAVDRNAWDDDQYGAIKFKVNRMVQEARRSYDRLAAATVEQGHLTLCYDGQNFFDIDHQEGTTGLQSNYNASGKPLNAQNVQDTVALMRLFQDDSAQLAGINPSHLMVPPTLEWTAKALVDPTYVGVTQNPAQAVLRGLLKVIVNPYITGTGGANAAWYVMDLTQPVKPFIYQNRKPLTFTASDNASDTEVFMSRTVNYGVDARFAFAYGDWKMAFKNAG